MNAILVLILSAAGFTATYDEGLLAYDNENFPQSIERFEELVYNRIYEPEVFYNLGNAYYRNGYLAPAIANYERALTLNPKLEEARANLRRTVVETAQALPKPPSSGAEAAIYFWHGGFSKTKSKTMAFVFWIVGFGILTVRIFKPKRFLRRASAVSFILAAIFAGSWGFKANPAELAVANGDKIPVRYGMKSTDTIYFELFEGDRVHIDEHNGEWIRVVTASGDRGWSREEYFITVWPP